MKDGKYEVGDVIALRWTGNKLRRGEVGNSFTFYDGPVRGESIFCNHGCPVDSSDAYILERIPNPQLMDGEWWRGWKTEYRRPNCGEVYIAHHRTDRAGELVVRGASNGKGGVFFLGERHDNGLRTVLIPPKREPCPELRAKIEKLEALLAELKKQALG